MPLSEEGSEEGIPMELELPPPIPSKPRGKQKAQEEVQPPSPPAEVVAAPPQKRSANPPPVSVPASPRMSPRRWEVMALSILVPTLVGLVIYKFTPATSPTSPTTSSTSAPNERQKGQSERSAGPATRTDMAAPNPFDQFDPPKATPKTYRLVNDTPGHVLDLRQGPGSNYPVVARMPQGVIPDVTLGSRRVANEGTIWQEISVQGYTGFVSETYLEAVGVIEFNADDIGQVLRLLARIAKVNVVVSQTVTGTVTIRLEDMTALQAISIIVKAKGLFMEKIDNVYYIKTAAERTAKPTASVEH